MKPTKQQAEVFELADLKGWSVEYDNEGQLVIYTGVYDKSRDENRTNEEM